MRSRSRWNALRVDDANDLGAIQKAIDSAKKVTDKPSIIVLKSVIGYGAPTKANTHSAHGAPLGAAALWVVMAAAIVSAVDYYRRFQRLVNARVTDVNIVRERREGERRTAKRNRV